jgi:mRNA interferase RelE/StbE
MPWTVELLEDAFKTLKQMDATTRNRIRRFIREQLQGTDNPRERGKALTGRYAGKWRYRVGDYRLICQLQDARLVVLVVEIGHRSDVYKGNL